MDSVLGMFRDRKTRAELTFGAAKSHTDNIVLLGNSYSVFTQNVKLIL